MAQSKKKASSKPLVPAPAIKQAIQRIRQKDVIIDADLAELYGVSTKQLNQAVKRNKDKFPADFMFELEPEEKKELVTNCDHLNRLKYSSVMPKAYTEHGLLQAANVLHSELADRVSVTLVRAFIQLRELVAAQSRETAAELSGAQGALSKPGLQSSLERRAENFLATVVPKIEEAVDKVLDTVIDTDRGTTVRQEAESLLSDSIQHLHAKLKKSGLENEEIVARITKLLAEAQTERAKEEKTRQEARKTKAEAEHRELVVMVRKLRLLLATQKFMLGDETASVLTGRVDVLIKTLEDLSRE